ncbi:MlaD family protein [Nocardioides terrisoli]|uniref:MlaD family protein n=1 Tax=Nocardioides terrisoli TaxID=3388267 RepID=UPI00287BC63A|nr:MlaD family protein [Nocardioides marmorisolisilvae]
MKALANRDPFRLGLVTIAVGVVLGLGVLLISVIPFGKSTYTAVLEQSAGLRAKEDVQVSGVRVGEVRSVKLVGSAVHVTFTVDKGIHLGSRTTAAVKVATLLGTHLLAVTPEGSGNLPHDTIPISRTSVPFNLQDVLDQGTHRVEQLDSAKLAKLFSTMARELAPSTQQFGPALQGVVRLSDDVARRSDQFGALLKAARSVTGQLSASSGDLIGLMKQTDLVVSEVTARRAAIHRLLVEARRLAHNVNAVIGQTKADVHPALRALNGALAELHRQDGTLRHVLDTMAPAVRYIANASGNAPYGDLHTYNNAGIIPPNDGIGCKLAGNC